MLLNKDYTLTGLQLPGCEFIFKKKKKAPLKFKFKVTYLIYLLEKKRQSVVTRTYKSGVYFGVSLQIDVMTERLYWLAGKSGER